MHKWTIFALLCAACVLGLVVLFTTVPDEPHQEAAPIVDVPLNVAAAETVYTTNCLMCHGDQLQGNSGPALNKVGSQLSQLQIMRKIENGVGMMPAFKSSLTAEEIANLSKWLHEMK